MKRFLLAGLAMALGLTVVGVIFFQRPPAHRVISQSNLSTLQKVSPPMAAMSAPSEIVPAQASIPASDNPVRGQAVKTKAPAKVATQASASSPNPTPTKKPKVILDPEARFALSFVGSDPKAEQYWLEAINDPDLPANERKNLIEDLNEDGLSDPDHPGLQDLPLIMNRLSILQQLAYDPMDKVNYDAIQEAAQDLQKMYDDLTAN